MPQPKAPSFVDSFEDSSALDFAKVQRGGLVLDDFLLLSSDGRHPLGLDIFWNVEKGNQCIKRGVYWKAHVEVRDPAHFQDTFLEEMRETLEMKEKRHYSLERVKELIDLGKVRISLHGKMIKLPSYMNSIHCPLGLRIHPVNNSMGESTTVMDLKFYYHIRSMHHATLKNSFLFLHKYSVQHFLLKTITLHKPHAPSGSSEDVIPWLVERYITLWHDARKLGTVKGRPPLKADVYHHLALQLEELKNWNTSPPVKKQVWETFGKRIEKPRRQAKEEGLRWGTRVELADLNMTSMEGREHQPSPEIEEFTTGRLHDDGDMQLDENAEVSYGDVVYEADVMLVEEMRPDSTENAMRQSWRKVLAEYIRPVGLPVSLIWYCPCPQEDGSRCTFHINLRRPSASVLNMLTPKGQEYLCPKDGYPGWSKTERRFHDLFYNLTYGHYDIAHLAPLGIGRASAAFKRFGSHSET